MAKKLGLKIGLYFLLQKYTSDEELKGYVQGLASTQNVTDENRGELNQQSYEDVTTEQVNSLVNALKAIKDEKYIFNKASDLLENEDSDQTADTLKGLLSLNRPQAQDSNQAQVEIPGYFYENLLNELELQMLAISSANEHYQALKAHLLVQGSGADKADSDYQELLEWYRKKIDLKPQAQQDADSGETQENQQAEKEEDTKSRVRTEILKSMVYVILHQDKFPAQQEDAQAPGSHVNSFDDLYNKAFSQQQAQENQGDQEQAQANQQQQKQKEAVINNIIREMIFLNKSPEEIKDAFANFASARSNNKDDLSGGDIDQERIINVVRAHPTEVVLDGVNFQDNELNSTQNCFAELSEGRRKWLGNYPDLQFARDLMFEQQKNALNKELQNLQEQEQEQEQQKQIKSLERKVALYENRFDKTENDEIKKLYATKPQEIDSKVKALREQQQKQLLQLQTNEDNDEQQQLQKSIETLQTQIDFLNEQKALYSKQCTTAYDSLVAKGFEELVVDDISRIISPFNVPTQDELIGVKGYITHLREQAKKALESSQQSDDDSSQSSQQPTKKPEDLLVSLIRDKHIPADTLFNNDLGFTTEEFNNAISVMLNDDSDDLAKKNFAFLHNNGYRMHLRTALISISNKESSNNNLNNYENLYKLCKKLDFQEDVFTWALAAEQYEQNIPVKEEDEQLSQDDSQNANLENEEEDDVQSLDDASLEDQQAQEDIKNLRAQAEILRREYDPYEYAVWDRKMFEGLEEHFVDVNTGKVKILPLLSPRYFTIKPRQFMSFVDWKESKEIIKQKRVKEKVSELQKENANMPLAQATKDAEKAAEEEANKEEEAVEINKAHFLRSKLLYEASCVQLEKWADENFDDKYNKALTEMTEKRVREEITKKEFEEEVARLKLEEPASDKISDTDIRERAKENLKKEERKQTIETKIQTKVEEEVKDRKASVREEYIEEGKKLLKNPSYYCMYNKINAIKSTLRPDQHEEIKDVLEESRSLIKMTWNSVAMGLGSYSQLAEVTPAEVFYIDSSLQQINHQLEQLATRMANISTEGEMKDLQEEIKADIVAIKNNLQIKILGPEDKSKTDETDDKKKKRKKIEEINEAIDNYVSTQMQNTELLLKANLHIKFFPVDDVSGQASDVEFRLNERKKLGSSVKMSQGSIEINEKDGVLTLKIDKGKKITSEDINTIVETIKGLGYSSVIFKSSRDISEILQIARALNKQGILVKLDLPDEVRSKNKDLIEAFEKENKALEDSLKGGKFAHVDKKLTDNDGLFASNKEIKAFLQAFSTQCQDPKTSTATLFNALKDKFADIKEEEDKKKLKDALLESFQEHKNDQHLGLLIVMLYALDLYQSMNKKSTSSSATSSLFTEDDKKVIKEDILAKPKHDLAKKHFNVLAHSMQTIKDDKVLNPVGEEAKKLNEKIAGLPKNISERVEKGKRTNIPSASS